MSLISATAWISRGKAARYPQKYNVDDAELARVSAIANVEFEDAKTQLERAQKAAMGMGQGEEDEEWADDDDEEEEEKADGTGTGAAGDQAMDADKDVKPEDPDGMSKYNLDDYDDEESTGAAMGAFSNIKGLQFYRSNEDDPYITMKEEEADDEREELEVLPSDNMLICAKTEDDVSQLEAYVYAHGDANLYVHHDLMLPSFPLCLEWLDYKPGGASVPADQNVGQGVGEKGNYVAVGTMDPEIEIWSMDTVEGLFPDAILGRKDQTEGLEGPLGTGKKKRKKSKPRIANAEYHVDAVLGLSWNRTSRNLLASASADTTVKLWDLSRPSGASALRSFGIHTDKVQSVAWSPTSAPVLLTGSYDKTMRVFDSRAPEQAVVAKIDADVEAVKWSPWREHNFFVSLESGLVQSFDARVLPSAPSSGSSLSTLPSAPALYTLAAHDSACTTLDISPHIPGCIVTGGSDKMVKIWNVEETASAVEGQEPSRSISLVTGRDLDVGKVFSTTFSPDDALTLAVAGSKGKLQIWDALSNVGVRRTFGDRLRALGANAPKIDGDEPARGDGVVGVADDSEEEEDGDGDGDESGEGGDAMEE